MNTLCSHDINKAIHQAIAKASGRIAPLWPLSRFVAVNPFVGFADTPFDEALNLLERNSKASLSLPPSYYRTLYAEGIISREDLYDVARTLHPESFKSPFNSKIKRLLAALDGDYWPDQKEKTTPLFSFHYDAAHGTRWAVFFTEEISKWCAAYFDEGQALWKMPWKGKPLFAAWREAASLDHNPAVAGLTGWRTFVRTLSDDPILEIEKGVAFLQIPEASLVEVFHSLLLSISGWAGHLPFLCHEQALQSVVSNQLTDLLAIRMAYEVALYKTLPPEERKAVWLEKTFSSTETSQESVPLSSLWQRAHEVAMQRQLFARLAEKRPLSVDDKPPVVTPAFQAVFCIDVRSEVFRRALEQSAPEGATLGFAGFFGFPIEAIPVGETKGTPHCPVLLAPAVPVPESASPRQLRKAVERKRFSSSWNAFKSSAVSSFVFVETAGLGFFAKLIRDLTHHGKESCCQGFAVDISSISLSTQIQMAAGALRHLGFSKEGLAPLVLLCGHGSTTKNNPYASSLDCGACGGHGGEANARTAAAILNNPEVRSGLCERGIIIPEKTWFLAGLHHTTTDEVTLYDVDAAPLAHHDGITRLKEALEQATLIARHERAHSLGIDPNSSTVNEAILDRSRDWSQVRPEWGLAGNYAFIAAPRRRTRGLDLGGRVFLNDYCYKADEEEATLELLLTAPVVVASWINLQYFASTVDNQHFGSGDKAIHNVAAALGVYEGNGGDIRVGLPFQSVNDGHRWMHDPLRLSVCVEAPTEAIDRVLTKHPGVADLVANQWIHLFAFSDTMERFLKSDGRGGWSDRLCR